MLPGKTKPGITRVCVGLRLALRILGRNPAQFSRIETHFSYATLRTRGGLWFRGWAERYMPEIEGHFVSSELQNLIRHDLPDIVAAVKTSESRS